MDRQPTQRDPSRADAGPPTQLVEWAHRWAAAQARPLGCDVPWRQTSSGAWLGFGSAVVVKVHADRTDRQALAVRVAAAATPQLRRWLVAPLTTAVGLAPGDRSVTLWPRVPVLDPADADQLPWVTIGAHLAGLHRTQPADLHRTTSLAALPAHGGGTRVERARVRAPSPLLRALGARLVRELAEAPARHTGLVHGDWHLGQLARMPDGWRLLDVDDLGVGDPAWDLGRPAGFWAAGLLADEDWAGLLAGYRAAAGPAVPPTGDPWPVLDLPARCAVFVAACRELQDSTSAHGAPTADALVAACERM